MNVSYSVQANIRTDKKKADGTCPIYYFVRLGAIVTKISSKHFIDPKEWDNKRKKPRITAKDGRLLSKILTDKIEGFKTFMLERKAFDKPLTPLVAKSYFENNQTIELFDFWEQQVTLMEKEFSINTIKSYNSVLKIIKEYNKKLCFGDINHGLLDRFDTYLKEKRNNALNGRFVKHKCLKRILQLAVINGYIKENPYKYWKIRSTPGDRKFLTIKEVSELKNLEFTEENSYLIRYRDLFLFSCWTGLRYSDVVSLKIANINIKDKPRIEIIIKKTKRKLSIPLTDNALDILKKYVDFSSTDYEKFVFPTVANPTINLRIKDLMKEIGVEKSISFHCARHSFACNHIESRTPVPIIRDSLGHTNITQTNLYVKSTESDIYECASKLNEMYN